MSKFGLPRLALVSSAAALVLAACFNGSDSVEAPSSKAIAAPKVLADFGTASAGLIQVCVDPGAPSGPYSVSFTAVTNVFFQNPEDNTNAYTKNDVEQTSPQSGINPGDCRLLFTKNHGTWIDGFGWLQSFTTMTITNSNGAQGGGTFSYICFPGGGPSALCQSGNPINPPVDGRADISPTATSGANPDHGSTVTFSYTLPVASICTLGYPDNSNLPKSGRTFNESEVLAAAQSVGGEVRAWYTDEHAMLLGERRIILKTPPPTGTLTFDHTYTFMSGNPSSAIGSPLVNLGPTALTGDGAAIDPFGRPLFPAVFITDITSNALSRSGDWQQGGLPFRPNKIFGTWKAVVASVDYTKAPPYVTTFASDADPSKNHLNLGAGSNAAPAGVTDAGGYSTEIVWTATSLGLNPTHNYRLQFMVHDGDQNKTGGDVGQSCMNIGPNVADRTVVF